MRIIMLLRCKPTLNNSDSQEKKKKEGLCGQSYNTAVTHLLCFVIKSIYKCVLLEHANTISFPHQFKSLNFN